MLAERSCCSLFAVYGWRGIRSAFKSTDEFGRFAALGITVMILSQTMINLGVVLGMMPTKGIPPPFISYGGSSLLVMLLATGILLNISRQADCSIRQRHEDACTQMNGMDQIGATSEGCEARVRQAVDRRRRDWRPRISGSGHCTGMDVTGRRKGSVIVGTQRGIERGWCLKQAFRWKRFARRGSRASAG